MNHFNFPPNPSSFAPTHLALSRNTILNFPKLSSQSPCDVLNNWQFHSNFISPVKPSTSCFGCNERHQTVVKLESTTSNMATSSRANKSSNCELKQHHTSIDQLMHLSLVLMLIFISITWYFLHTTSHKQSTANLMFIIDSWQNEFGAQFIYDLLWRANAKLTRQDMGKEQRKKEKKSIKHNIYQAQSEGNETCLFSHSTIRAKLRFMNAASLRSTQSMPLRCSRQKSRHSSKTTVWLIWKELFDVWRGRLLSTSEQNDSQQPEWNVSVGE